MGESKYVRSDVSVTEDDRKTITRQKDVRTQRRTEEDETRQRKATQCKEHDAKQYEDKLACAILCFFALPCSVFFCLVLSCLAMCCLVLSRLVLSCFVLCCVVLG